MITVHGGQMPAIVRSTSGSSISSIHEENAECHAKRTWMARQGARMATRRVARLGALKVARCTRVRFAARWPVRVRQWRVAVDRRRDAWHRDHMASHQANVVAALERIAAVRRARKDRLGVTFDLSRLVQATALPRDDLATRTAIDLLHWQRRRIHSLGWLLLAAHWRRRWNGVVARIRTRMLATGVYDAANLRTRWASTKVARVRLYSSSAAAATTMTNQCQSPNRIATTTRLHLYLSRRMMASWWNRAIEIAHWWRRVALGSARHRDHLCSAVARNVDRHGTRKARTRMAQHLALVILAVESLIAHLGAHLASASAALLLALMSAAVAHSRAPIHARELFATLYTRALHSTFTILVLCRCERARQ